jgi:hypothetical protein
MIPVTSDGWLVPGTYGPVRVVRHEQTPKTMTLLPEMKNRPIGLVWHWAAGGYGTGLNNNVTNYMIDVSYNADRKASWHFFVNKRGEIHQFAPLTLGTWTTGTPGKLWDRVAGVPVYKSVSNVNRATIGVEMENAGVLLPSGDKWYAWPYGIGAEGMSEAQAREAAAAGRISFQSQYAVDTDRAQRWADGNVYDRWPPEQVFAAQEMVRAISAYLGWEDPERINYGHRTFHAKRDPGLLWMDKELPVIQRNIFGKRGGGVASSPNTPLFLLTLAGAGFVIWKYGRS